MGVRYQCDRCGRYFDDAGDFRRVKVWPSDAERIGVERFGRTYCEAHPMVADLCQECSELLRSFLEGVC